MAEDTISKQSRPRAKTIIIIITAVMTIRVAAIMFLPEAARPESPLVSFLIPFLGDTIVGLTAPIIAVLLWKWNTLGAWTAAIAWHTLAIWDSASAAVLVTVAGDIRPFAGAGVGVTPLIVITLLGLVNLYLLSGRSVRYYYTK